MWEYGDVQKGGYQMKRVNIMRMHMLGFTLSGFTISFFWKCKWVGDSPIGKLTKLYLPRHDFMQRNGLFPPSGPTWSEFHVSFKAWYYKWSFYVMSCRTKGGWFMENQLKLYLPPSFHLVLVLDIVHQISFGTVLTSKLFSGSLCRWKIQRASLCLIKTIKLLRIFTSAWKQVVKCLRFEKLLKSVWTLLSIKDEQFLLPVEFQEMMKMCNSVQARFWKREVKWLHTNRTMEITLIAYWKIAFNCHQRLYIEREFCAFMLLP